MQVWLQSCKTRLTLRMPTRAVSIWQVDDLKLLLPGSELLVTNEHNDSLGAHLIFFSRCWGMGMFTRRGPFQPAYWFCGFALNKGL